MSPARLKRPIDESTGTIEKRFNSIKVENTEANRQAYRDMLFTTPGFEKHTSGVILFEETLFQKGLDGTPVSQTLAAKGATELVECGPGTVLAGLNKRCAEGVSTSNLNTPDAFAAARAAQA